MDPVSRPTSLDDTHLVPLSSLGDATRRRLYEHVAAAGRPLTRDDVSAALGLDRSLVAYHLDKLVEEGLLEASFARPPGRGGPGAGRPAKRYRRSEREFAVSAPPRDYRLVAELLARAVEADRSGAVRRALLDVAADVGRELVTSSGDRGDLVDHLVRQGFEPFLDEQVIRLRNCPFHRLSREHTEVVCGMNLALLSGVVDALGAPYQAVLDPLPGGCCVAFAERG